MAPRAARPGSAPLTIGHRHVIAFPHAESTLLVKVILRGWKFLEVIARFIHRAISARRPGLEKLQDVYVSRDLKNLAAIGGKIIGKAARHKRGGITDRRIQNPIL